MRHSEQEAVTVGGIDLTYWLDVTLGRSGYAAGWLSDAVLVAQLYEPVLSCAPREK